MEESTCRPDKYNLLEDGTAKQKTHAHKVDTEKDDSVGTLPSISSKSVFPRSGDACFRK